MPTTAAADSSWPLSAIARRASSRAAVVSGALFWGFVVSEVITVILPKGGPWWAVGTATVMWAAAAGALFLLHAALWHYRRRGRPNWPGDWTWAVEESPVSATVSSIALAGAGTAWALVTKGAAPAGATTIALVAAGAAVVLTLLLWYGLLLLRTWHAHRTQRPRPELAPHSPAAEWMIGAATAARPRRPW